jgi:uncharacterized membrane protein YgaE (UPF0421/DUF939 family)
MVRLRLDGVLAVQAGVAAGLSWIVAHDVLRHPRPFFAPIAAVIVLGGGAMGPRWRRAVELVLGVAIGIAVGDAFVLFIGVGGLQIALVVVLAIVVAIFFKGGNVAVNQAAASGVLVATLSPPTGGGIYVDRFVDALVGGLLGIGVLALLLPLHPLTRVRRDAGRALADFAASLRQTGEALRQGDPDLADQALAQLREFEDERAKLRDSLVVGRETAVLSPMRWRSKPALDQYLDATVHVERATRNVRVAQRRVLAMLRDHEPVPPGLADAFDHLADSATHLTRDLARMVEPVDARAAALDAVRAASTAYVEGVGFSGSSVVAQVRSAAMDLLQATGLVEAEARDAVRNPPPP